MGPLVGLLAGVLFALGLAISGMTDGNNIVAFLDIAGAWDPRLALVMVGAIGAHAAMMPILRRRSRPRFTSEYLDPRPGKIDARLWIGAGLFGVGWGVAGLCPGPVLVMLPSAAPPVLAFTGAMIAGMWIYDRWNARTAGAPLSLE